MTMHHEWIDRLSDYLDDELPEAERAEVAAHLAGCAECTRVLEELSNVTRLAATLPTTPPARDLWPAIAEQLTPSPAARVLHLPQRRVSIRVFELVAAGLALAVASGVIATRWLVPDAGRASIAQTQSAPSAMRGDVETAANRESSDGLPARVMAASLDNTAYNAAVMDLEAALRAERSRLDPTTVRVVEDNLAIIDQALEDAQRALAADPADEYLGDHLVQTRRRKLELLRRAATLTDTY